jgi:hypothetical protein
MNSHLAPGPDWEYARQSAIYELSFREDSALGKTASRPRNGMLKTQSNADLNSNLIHACID